MLEDGVVAWDAMRVEGIFIATAEGADMQRVESVVAVTGKGLRGDRYFDDDRAPVSLIEVEALEACAGKLGIEVPLGASRRAIVTSGVELNDLVGHTFRVGDVVLEGLGLAHPCGLMEKVIGKGAKKALENHGGLYARVVAGGAIASGDGISL